MSTIIVNRKQLSKAIKSLKSIKLKRPNYIIETNHDNLTLHVTDTETSLSIELDATCDRIMTGSFTLNDMSAIVKLLKDKTIDIGELKTHDVIAPVPHIFLKTHDAIAPVPHIFDSGTTITLTSDQIDSIQRASLAASKDYTKYVLKGVNFQKNNIASTDGFQLIVATTNISSDINYTVDALHLSKLSQIGFGENTTLIFDELNNKATFKSDGDGGGIILSVPMLESTFPDYESIIPSEFNSNLVVNTKQFKDNCQYIVDTKSNHVRIDIDSDRAVMHAMNRDNDIVKTFVIDSDSIQFKETLSIPFDPAYLLKAISSFDCVEMSSSLSSMTNLKLCLPANIAIYYI